MNLEPCILPGDISLFTLHVPIGSDLQPIPIDSLFEEKHLVHQGWANVWAHSL